MIQGISMVRIMENQNNVMNVLLLHNSDASEACCCNVKEFVGVYTNEGKEQKNMELVLLYRTNAIKCIEKISLIREYMPIAYSLIANGQRVSISYGDDIYTAAKYICTTSQGDAVWSLCSRFKDSIESVYESLDRDLCKPNMILSSDNYIGDYSWEETIVNK